jgi:hypothetical protein
MRLSRPLKYSGYVTENKNPKNSIGIVGFESRKLLIS